MKKVISLLLATVMLSASAINVSAATYEPIEDYITDLSSKEELSALVPTLEISEPEYLNDYDAIKGVAGASFANTYFGNPSNETKYPTTVQNDYDIYSFTMTVGNLGDLAYGYNENEEVVYASMNGLNVYINYGDVWTSGSEKIKATYFKTDLTKHSTSSAIGRANQGTFTGYTGHYWIAKDGTYPFWSTDDYDSDGYCAFIHDNASLTYTITFAVAENATFSASEYAIGVDYSVDDGSGDLSFTIENVVTADEIEFSKPVTDAVNSVTIKNGGADAGDSIAAKLGDDDITLSADVDVTGSADTSVTWASNADSVATVDNGVVTIKGVGTATITATSTADGTKSDSVDIVVTLPDVTGVSLSANELSLDVYNNKTATLTATVSPALANQEVTWESDDEDVATVSGGLVTAKGEGTATITVKSVADPSKTATCTVTVTDSTPAQFSGVIRPADLVGTALEGKLEAGYMIVVDTQSCNNVSANTRVTVTYNNGTPRVFGTTLGEYLQLGEGMTFTGNIKFAVVCQDTLTASAFAFSIQ